MANPLPFLFVWPLRDRYDFLFFFFEKFYRRDNSPTYRLNPADNDGGEIFAKNCCLGGRKATKRFDPKIGF